MRPKLHPEADAEVLDAIRFYNGQRADLGWEFYDELYDVLTAIERNPRRCPWDDDQVHRRCTLKRFKFAVVYKPDRSPIQIIAVHHQARDPGYWRLRTF